MKTYGVALFCLSWIMIAVMGCQTVDRSGSKEVLQQQGPGDTIAKASQNSTWGTFQEIPEEVRAPEFPDGLDWLNTAQPLSIAALRGKVIILDFWTYGCINCMHIIPDLKRLEDEYSKELIVIGVHSAKFTNEQTTENIKTIIDRYELSHPVVNDHQLIVARQWHARYWPTLALIDPTGNVVGIHSGEGVYDTLKPVVEALIKKFDVMGKINRDSIVLTDEAGVSYSGSLSFPGKVLADEEGERIFISDGNHHRIIVADIFSGQVIEIIGGPDRGYRDGAFTTARFNMPQGMALTENGTLLYVADTGNHTVRSVDLSRRSVSTLVGTGTQAPENPPVPGPAPNISLQSPWDVGIQMNTLYIAMAGSHQIWTVDLTNAEVRPFAGSGIEGTRDGPRNKSELAQPSGLTFDDEGYLYFADSESSSIRRINTAKRFGHVETIAGGGRTLFEFGDADGTGYNAQFQHPLGVVYYDNVLYVADTYNSKIKKVYPDQRKSQTLFGSEHGFRDGVDPLFYEPGGIDAAFGNLYVADTNNHSIRVINISDGQTYTLRLKGNSRLNKIYMESEFTGEIVEQTPVEIKTGPSRIILDVKLPEGYKLNPDAVSSFELTTTGDISAELSSEAEAGIMDKLPYEVHAVVTGNFGFIQLDLFLVYCRVENEEVCFFGSIRILTPVNTRQNGATELIVHHTVKLQSTP